jgi:hypothetical protein
MLAAIRRVLKLKIKHGGFGLQALEYGENVMTMLFDAPKAPMAIISNPLRSTRKSVETTVVSPVRNASPYR